MKRQLQFVMNVLLNIAPLCCLRDQDVSTNRYIGTSRTVVSINYVWSGSIFKSAYQIKGKKIRLITQKGTAHWSYGPLVLRPIGPTAHWSYSPLVLRPIGPMAHWSYNSLVLWPISPIVLT